MTDQKRPYRKKRRAELERKHAPANHRERGRVAWDARPFAHFDQRDRRAGRRAPLDPLSPLPGRDRAVQRLQLALARLESGSRLEPLGRDRRPRRAPQERPRGALRPLSPDRAMIDNLIRDEALMPIGPADLRRLSPIPRVRSRDPDVGPASAGRRCGAGFAPRSAMRSPIRPGDPSRASRGSTTPRRPMSAAASSPPWRLLSNSLFYCLPAYRVRGRGEELADPGRRPSLGARRSLRGDRARLRPNRAGGLHRREARDRRRGDPGGGDRGDRLARRVADDPAVPHRDAGVR